MERGQNTAFDGLPDRGQAKMAGQMPRGHSLTAIVKLHPFVGRHHPGIGARRLMKFVALGIADVFNRRLLHRASASTIRLIARECRSRMKGQYHYQTRDLPLHTYKYVGGAKKVQFRGNFLATSSGHSHDAIVYRRSFHPVFN